MILVVILIVILVVSEIPKVWDICQYNHKRQRKNETCMKHEKSSLSRDSTSL